MTIVETWYDEAEMGWNGRVQDRPEINASALDQLGGQPAMRNYIVEAWNREFPDELKTIKDFAWERTDARW
jgi:hypothetical protein